MQIPFVDLGAQYLEIREEFLERIDAIGKSGQYILGEECRQSSQGCSEGRFGLIGDDSLDWLLRKGWGNKAKSSCKGMRLEMSAFT